MGKRRGKVLRRDLDGWCKLFLFACVCAPALRSRASWIAHEIREAASRHNLKAQGLAVSRRPIHLVLKLPHRRALAYQERLDWYRRPKRMKKGKDPGV
jgi:hypothetical protein